jgi:hypothetical protein
MLLPLLVASSVLCAEPSAPPLVPTDVAEPPLVQVEQKARVRSPKKGLLIAGTAVLGGSYLLSLFTAALTEISSRSLPVVPPQTSSYTGLFVPVAGPIIALADPRNQNASMTPLLVLDAVAQTGGLVLLIVGLAMPAPETAKTPTVWLVPTAGASGAGATFGMRF